MRKVETGCPPVLSLLLFFVGLFALLLRHSLAVCTKLGSEFTEILLPASLGTQEECHPAWLLSSLFFVAVVTWVPLSSRSSLRRGPLSFLHADREGNASCLSPYGLLERHVSTLRRRLSLHLIAMMTSVGLH